MARHRAQNGLTFSRARHRAPTPMQRRLERGVRSVATTLAAAMLVMAMLSDPSFPTRN